MVQVSSMWSRGIILLLPLLFFLSPSFLPAQVRTLDLREMVKSSGMIFIGTVSQARGATDEHGDIVTYTTFRVERALHGTPGNGTTTKQFGGDVGNMGTRLDHMRYFHEGERVLVMFYPVSSLGFTSPIGLNQAVWSINDDGTVHGVSDEILKGLGPLLQRHGLSMREMQSVPVTTFIALINDLLREGTKP